MRRIHIVSMLALLVTIPTATAVTYVSQNGKAAATRPCFVAGNAGYQFTAGGPARHVVRIDNDAVAPHLRMQLVDDPAAADFVLVDDSDATCKDVSLVNAITIDMKAEKPDLVIAVSRQPADYKIYLHSDSYTEQQAAALAAVIWHNAGKSRPMRSANLNR